MLPAAVPLTNRIAWGKVSFKSIEITSDNRAFSHQLSAFSKDKSHFADS